MYRHLSTRELLETLAYDVTMAACAWIVIYMTFCLAF